MITINLMGGLGNQLFQIFTTISYALEYNQKFCFENCKKLGTEGSGNTIRYTFFDTFLYGLNEYLVEKSPVDNSYVKISESEFRYNKICFPEQSSNVLLYGYFQSPMYFETHFTKICDLLNISVQQELTLSKCASINYNKTISMHFRLGDYKNKQMYHNVLPIKYYQNALSHIVERIGLSENVEDVEKWNMLYFCENEDIECVKNMINELKNQFKQFTFIRANENLADWEQLLLMSVCEHNIIANSTFSWWGAYFNKNSNKIVCYPSKWFGPWIPVDVRDLFPNNWNKLNID